MTYQPSRALVLSATAAAIGLWTLLAIGVMHHLARACHGPVSAWCLSPSLAEAQNAWPDGTRPAMAETVQHKFPSF